MGNTQEQLIAYLERLSGHWVGEGIGEYPTIEAFQYREELSFILVESKAYLHYEQRTWRKDKNGKEVPSHWETGFWRVISNDEVELTCAQSGGRLEAARGRIVPMEGDFVLSLRSNLFANDMRVEQTQREFILRGDTLKYTMKMQTTAVPELAIHLSAQLKRKSS